MHAVTPYLLKSYHKYNKEKKSQEYFNLDKIKGFDLLVIIHKFMKLRSANVYDFPDDKKVYKFTDIKFDNDNRTVSAFLMAGSYGIKTDIYDKNTGAISFPKNEDEAEVLKHYIQFTVPPNSTDAVGIFHKSHGVGIKTLFDKLFKPHYRSKTGFILQINPFAHTKAVDEWVDKAQVKEFKVQGYLGNSDVAENIAHLGQCNTEFSITPKSKKGIIPSFGALKDFINPSHNSKVKEIITFMSTQGSNVKAVASLNGSTRTFSVGTNSSGVYCDVQIEKGVTIQGGQPEYQSIRKWAFILTNDIMKGVYGKNAYQLS